MNYKVQWPSRGHTLTATDLVGLEDLLTSNSPMTNGPLVAQFEADFREQFKLQNCMATMSCAHALDMVAMVLGEKYGPEAEVIIPTHTYCATAIAFGRVGLNIVWSDIDKKSKVISLENIMKVVTNNTKAIVVVHLYGLIAPDMEAIVNYCKDHDIILIEDCAQSVGAIHLNTYAGGFGDFATFSFHAQKNLSTLGEGGMLVFKNDDLAQKLRGIRLNGHRSFQRNKNEPYWLPAMTDVYEDLKNSWPIKSTLTEAQAFLGSKLLKRLNTMNAKRKKDALFLKEKLANIDGIKFQKNLQCGSHANHLFPIWVDQNKINRDKVIKYLSEISKVQAIIQYHPLHKYDLFVKKIGSSAEFPSAESSYKSMISLPFWEGQTIDELEYIANETKIAVEKCKL